MPQVSDSEAAAITLLYDNIHALPSEEYGVINMLPFAHDSEQARAVTRQVCEAIISLLSAHGLLKTQADTSEPVISRSVAVKCRTCATELVSLVTDENGIAMVDARRFIAQLSGSNPECNHAAITLEDMRLKMEREFYAAVQDESSQSANEASANEASANEASANKASANKASEVSE